MSTTLRTVSACTARRCLPLVENISDTHVVEMMCYTTQIRRNGSKPHYSWLNIRQEESVSYQHCAEFYGNIIVTNHTSNLLKFDPAFYRSVKVYLKLKLLKYSRNELMSLATPWRIKMMYIYICEM